MVDASMSAAELDEYATAIRDFARRRLPDVTTARPGVPRDPAPPREHWRGLAVDLGAAGLLVPAENGGEGASLIEAGRVAEALGAELASLPYLAAGVLAPTLLRRLDSEASGELLGRIAEGAVVTVAWAGDDPGSISGELRVSGDRATGSFHYAIDADLADVVLLVGSDAVIAVPADQLQITARPTFDLTRGLCDVSATDAPVTVLGEGSQVSQAFSDMLGAGRLALAADCAGGAQAALALAVGYAKERIQFGREIGSFQAVKHLLADAYVASESAISVARAAIAAHEAGEPDAAQLTALAAFYPAEKYVEVAATGIQVHGGIGFTVERAAHLFRRRAESARHLLGDPAALKDQYVGVLATEGDAA